MTLSEKLDEYEEQKLKEFESKRKDEPIKAGRFVGLM